VSIFVHGGGPGVDGGPSVVCRWIVDKNGWMRDDGTKLNERASIDANA